jgi:hypothetical protein
MTAACRPSALRSTCSQCHVPPAAGSIPLSTARRAGIKDAANVAWPGQRRSMPDSLSCMFTVEERNPLAASLAPNEAEEAIHFAPSVVPCFWSRR